MLGSMVALAEFHGGIGRSCLILDQRGKKPRSRERRTQIRFWVSRVRSV